MEIKARSSKFVKSNYTPDRAKIYPHERSHSDLMVSSHIIPMVIAIWNVEKNKEFCIALMVVIIFSYYYHLHGEKKNIASFLELHLSYAFGLYTFVQLGYIRNHYAYGILLLDACLHTVFYYLTSVEKILEYETFHLFNHVSLYTSAILIPNYGKSFF